MRAQTSLLDEIIVDNFAGGGGASTGIELALGRPVDIAINHDPDAILMHRTNHPFTEHLQASVWDINPVEVCRGRPVGLAWFSPDCKHFSKAKGSKPVNKKIRGLAWIALRWAGTVRPRVIILENVEEFQTWGPVRKGKPVKKKAGQTFQKFIQQFKDLGYAVEYRELVAADYGAPTIRKRFFLIARCDGLPIVWPAPTHSRDGKDLPKWRSAAEIIDWTIPCPSIFASKTEIKRKYGVTAVRPLADATMKRIACGVDKFTIKSAAPYIVPIGYGERAGQAPRIHDITEPMPTIVSGGKHYVTEPVIAPFALVNNTTWADTTAVKMSEPLRTITTGGHHILCAPSLIQYHSEQSEKVRGQRLDDTLMTVDAANRYGLASAQLTEYFGNGKSIPVTDPMHTITAKDRENLTMAHLTKYYGGVIGAEVEQPLPTVTPFDHNALTAAHVVKFKGTNLGQHASEPLQTATAGGHHYGTVYTAIVKAEPGADLRRWPEIRAMLNKYCGYSLADDEVILLWISGVAYFIADIGLRMLTPRELYAAQGFPSDYIIEFDFTGKPYPKSAQVARCGNAVCPPLATALVRANMNDMASTMIISTMEQLNRLVAV
jgi:DNA (cytosine-5)-methyltransferase 1